MRAVVVDRYGPPEVAQVRDVPAPAPGPGQVLVDVAAAAVTSGDARMRSGTFPPGFTVPGRLALGLRGPRRRVLGATLSGDVVALGPGVTGVAVGDRVCAMTGARGGGHAQLALLDARRLAVTPPGLSHDAAAAVLFGGMTALDYLRDRAHVAPGATVLVNGASGAVGSSAVQIARHLGAHVTGVTSAANADLVTRLGADRVVDHRAGGLDDLRARGERFDVVLDAVGNLRPATGRPLLTASGVLLLLVAGLGDLLTARGPVKAGPASEAPGLVAAVLALAADGVLDPLVESTHPLAGIVDAYRRVDSGRKVGNVLVHPRAD